MDHTDLDHTVCLHLAHAGTIPNNPALPVICYRQACPEADEEELRERLAGHGWPPAWTGTIYGYDHYHSSAHEFLAVLRGEATVALGGAAGESLTLQAGDAVVLPAGTGHRLVDEQGDFLVLAAYPDGQDWDLFNADDELTPTITDRIAQLPTPERDPLFGDQGPLARAWW